MKKNIYNDKNNKSSKLNENSELITWIIDSGASIHITKKLEILDNITPISNQ